jgi:hypothetical protein
MNVERYVAKLLVHLLQQIRIVFASWGSSEMVVKGDLRVAPCPRAALTSSKGER